ncbi:MAG: hypothetical protein Q8J74_00805 [Candidatus Didemnitutus sp.]|nr:hypothetical protein [Candidatus Didemnitutus sp.]
MLAVVAEHTREQARAELRFMQAIYLAVPSALDSKARPTFEKREQHLLQIANA